MKIKVQAQHLQPGDIVGSGEKIEMIQIAGIKIPSNKVGVVLTSESHIRSTLWGKYTMINVERAE